MKHHTKPLLLIFPFGLLSHYLRCLVLARHLSPYFRIKFASHIAYDHFVISEGFGTFDCDGFDENKVMEGARNFDFSWLNLPDMEKVLLSQAAVIKHYQPSVVLSDATPTLKMAAEINDVLYISLLNNYMSKYYATTRSLSASHPAYNLVSLVPLNIRNHLIRIGEALAFKEIHKPFKELRAKYGLSRKLTYQDEIEGDTTLLCDAAQLFPLKSLPPGYFCIGPLIYNDTRSLTYSIAQQLNPKKKTLFVSMGSTGEWEKMAFLNDLRYSEFNVISAGDKAGILHATHIIKTNFVAPAEILPNTDLVICHGGNGTIYQALLFGVPMLCLSSHFEQEWNINAMEANGLAKCLATINESEYHSTIEVWASRKSQPIYKEISIKVNEGLEQLDTTLRSVAFAVKDNLVLQHEHYQEEF